MPKSAEELGAIAGRSWAELGVGTEAELDAILAEFRTALRDSTDRDLWLSRSRGIVRALTDHWLKTAPKEWKRPVGAAVNALRQEVEAHFAGVEAAPAAASSPAEDTSLPGRPSRIAPAHPVLQVRDEIVSIFLRLGYSVADGPEIESVYYNFEALNIPEGHPTREEQDTLFLNVPNHVLRTHTSPVQIHSMEAQRPPLRVIVPGKCYRRDAPDATHSPNFQQVEGLAVDRGLTFGDLRGTLDHFARELFGSAVRTRLRPSYFQFTEPSAELDVSCIFCGGRGCRTCKQSGWIELLGCGMVDPAVFGYVGYDPEEFSGFAFGLGIERMAMIRYGIDDLQRFYSGDLRFLEQFA